MDHGSLYSMYYPVYHLGCVDDFGNLLTYVSWHASCDEEYVGSHSAVKLWHYLFSNGDPH